MNALQVLVPVVFQECRMLVLSLFSHLYVFVFVHRIQRHLHTRSELNQSYRRSFTVAHVVGVHHQRRTEMIVLYTPQIKVDIVSLF